MTQGRRVVITGGAAGLGRAMATAFQELGDRVAVCDTDPAELADISATLPRVRAEPADVTDPVAMDRFLSGIESDWGGADIVVSNAGIGGPAGPIETLALEDWQRCLSVNLDGAFLTCRWAARVLRAQGSGVILLMASTSGLHGFPYRSPYVAAKWGIVGLARALASELGPDGVRVNAICPGAVEGPRMDRVVAMEAAARGLSPEEVRRSFSDGVALRQFVTPRDVADMAVFLASDAARRITGQAMAVDGHTERVT